ncbi:Branched-chain-amino-acid aminotransferase [Limihaloglobus sulfuriphilus]|uniref:branched-chain-amino-acid transaminase n=1 Tax=Limihaloglobus sulfuriphilus TaxID=1851148 RepID=A0A1Q2MEA7_9BACT|nr:aminotransferase class IV [Limihaloglobus sulfuriphilus]AQQ70878.1 Branched-chain-amino-acid aminotransferase [Limihaloglobus sulfuriphilus]
MSNKVFFNGNICSVEDVKIPVSDSGFLYGAGVFETMRSLNGVVFAVKDHLDRLFFSLDCLKFNHGLQREEVIENIYKVVDANHLLDSRIRLTVTNGPLILTEEPSPTIIITATDFQPYPDEYYENGIKTIVTNNRLNPHSPTTHFKTTSYLERLAAMNEARGKGAAEAIWFTTDNKLAQGSMSNLFIVKDSVIYTPPIETPVLAGIARERVLKIAMDRNMQIKEDILFIKDLLEADEVFLTNVIMEVMPVNSVERHTIGSGVCGPVAKELLQLYREHMQQECKER